MVHHPPWSRRSGSTATVDTTCIFSLTRLFLTVISSQKHDQKTTHALISSNGSMHCSKLHCSLRAIRKRDLRFYSLLRINVYVKLLSVHYI